MENAQFQIYTGNGKGKTTAAMGLALRAAGRGLNVYIGQFIKDMKYGEINILENLPNVCVELFGTGHGCLINKNASEDDFKCASKGVKKIKSAMASGKYDVVIADEINVAESLGLISEEDCLNIISSRPDNVELIFTGINACKASLKKADLITTMECTKHYYYEKGLLARDGIER